MKQKITHFDEILGESNIMALGDIQVDIERISSYNSIRMLQLIQNVRDGSASLMTDATEIVLDIVNEQNPGYTEEQLLKSGTQKQLNMFVRTIVQETIKTYAPLTSSDNPLMRTPLKETTAAKE